MKFFPKHCIGCILIAIMLTVAFTSIRYLDKQEKKLEDESKMNIEEINKLSAAIMQYDFLINRLYQECGSDQLYNDFRYKYEYNFLHKVPSFENYKSFVNINCPISSHYRDDYFFYHQILDVIYNNYSLFKKVRYFERISTQYKSRLL